MIALVQARSKNMYVFSYENYTSFMILKRVKIIVPDLAKELIEGYKTEPNKYKEWSRGWTEFLRIIKSYETIEQYIEDQFIELL